MAGEYSGYSKGLGHIDDYVALTGDMAASNSTDLARDLKGLNISVAGDVKITTDKGTAITVYYPVGDVGTPIIRRLWVTGTTATIKAGII